MVYVSSGQIRKRLKRGDTQLILNSCDDHTDLSGISAIRDMLKLNTPLTTLFIFGNTTQAQHIELL